MTFNDMRLTILRSLMFQTADYTSTVRAWHGSCNADGVHQAVAFALASDFCCKRPFTRNFCRFLAISFAKSLAVTSDCFGTAQFATFSVRFSGYNSLGASRGASVHIRFRIHNLLPQPHPGSAITIMHLPLNAWHRRSLGSHAANKGATRRLQLSEYTLPAVSHTYCQSWCGSKHCHVKVLTTLCGQNIFSATSRLTDRSRRSQGPHDQGALRRCCTSMQAKDG